MEIEYRNPGCKSCKYFHRNWTIFCYSTCKHKDLLRLYIDSIKGLYYEERFCHNLNEDLNCEKYVPKLTLWERFCNLFH